MLDPVHRYCNQFESLAAQKDLFISRSEGTRCGAKLARQDPVPTAPDIVGEHVLKPHRCHRSTAGPVQCLKVRIILPLGSPCIYCSPMNA